MENKKSFILYTDLIKVVEKLPDEIAGKLFKIILRYVNDLEVCIDDLLLEIAFEPIKLQLKRDLIKYKKIQDRSRENGKKGGRPKKEVNLKTQKTQGFNSKPKKAVNDTVTVTDSVTVTVNDNVNVNETKNKKEEILYFPFESEEFKNMWSLWKTYKKDEHKFTYKSRLSEQAALKKIGELANGNEQDGIAIIEASIANGYKGLFKLNENKNGKSITEIPTELRNSEVWRNA